MDEDKYEVARQWKAGFAAAICHAKDRLLSESDHWLAGWDAGYKLRHVRYASLNEYLISIGREPMGVVVLMESRELADELEGK